MSQIQRMRSVFISGRGSTMIRKIPKMKDGLQVVDDDGNPEFDKLRGPIHIFPTKDVNEPTLDRIIDGITAGDDVKHFGHQSNWYPTRAHELWGLKRELLSISGELYTLNELQERLSKVNPRLRAIVHPNSDKGEYIVFATDDDNYHLGSHLGQIGFVLNDVKKALKRAGTLYATPTHIFDGDPKITIDDSLASCDGDYIIRHPDVKGIFFAQCRHYTKDGMVKGLAVLEHGKEFEVITGHENFKRGLSYTRGSKSFGFTHAIGDELDQLNEENSPPRLASASQSVLFQTDMPDEHIKELTEASAKHDEADANSGIKSGRFFEYLTGEHRPQKRSKNSNPERAIRDAVVHLLVTAGVPVHLFVGLILTLKNPIRYWKQKMWRQFHPEKGWTKEEVKRPPICKEDVSLDQDGKELRKPSVGDSLKERGVYLNRSSSGLGFSMKIFMRLKKAKKILKKNGLRYDKLSGLIYRTNKNGYEDVLHAIDTNCLKGMPNGILLVSEVFKKVCYPFMGGPDNDGDRYFWFEAEGKFDAFAGPGLKKKTTRVVYFGRYPQAAGEYVGVSTFNCLLKTAKLRGAKNLRVPELKHPELRMQDFEIEDMPVTGEPWSRESEIKYAGLNDTNVHLGQMSNSNNAQAMTARDGEVALQIENETLIDSFTQKTKSAAGIKSLQSIKKFMDDKVCLRPLSKAIRQRFSGLDHGLVDLDEDECKFATAHRLKAQFYGEARDNLVLDFLSAKGMAWNRASSLRLLAEEHTEVRMACEAAIPYADMFEPTVESWNQLKDDFRSYLNSEFKEGLITKHQAALRMFAFVAFVTERHIDDDFVAERVTTWLSDVRPMESPLFAGETTINVNHILVKAFIEAVNPDFDLDQYFANIAANDIEAYAEDFEEDDIPDEWYLQNSELDAFDNIPIEEDDGVDDEVYEDLYENVPSDAFGDVVYEDAFEDIEIEEDEDDVDWDNLEDVD